MMKQNLVVGIIDYKINNILSVCNGVQKLGYKAKIIQNNKDKGDYKFIEDTIFIRPKGYKSNEEFIITLLHEIHHAVRVHRYGLKKFLKMYQQADDVALSIGGEKYRDNKWEKKAEGWAKHEYKRYFKDKFFDV